MIKSTLCYIEHNDCYLMLYRNKKNNDPNAGKWIGVGGKIEPGETPLACVAREVNEETGLSGLDFLYRGIVHFKSDMWEDEDMYLFTAIMSSDEDGCAECSKLDVADCNEGELKWIPKDQILSLPMWQGDRIFLEKLLSDCSKRDNQDNKTFELTLNYVGEELVCGII